MFRTETEMVLNKARRSLLIAALALFALAGVGVSLIALAVAGTVALAEIIGWAAATAVVAGISLIVFGSIATFVALRSTASDAASSTQGRSSGTTPHDPQGVDGSSTHGAREGTDGPPESSTPSLADRALLLTAQHPQAVIGGALAVIAIVGPWRTLKLTSRALMAVNVVRSLSQATDHQSDTV